MKRAISVSELLATRYDTYKLSDEWKAAFGEPERNGVWFVWGRSGSGKTSFVLNADSGEWLMTVWRRVRV